MAWGWGLGWASWASALVGMHVAAVAAAFFFSLLRWVVVFLWLDDEIMHGMSACGRIYHTQIVLALLPIFVLFCTSFFSLLLSLSLGLSVDTK
jgi:hypothetical protein